MNAYDELIEKLEEGEHIEGIVFGPFGCGSPPRSETEPWKLGYDEPRNIPVPFNKRGVVLNIDEARPMMDGWSFYTGYGAPECYAVYIWTNKRIFWVTQYDGATGLCSAPRHPIDTMPDMPGG